MVIGTLVCDGGMPFPGQVTEITDEGFWVGEYLFEWEDPSYYKGFELKYL